MISAECQGCAQQAECELLEEQVSNMFFSHSASNSGFETNLGSDDVELLDMAIMQSLSPSQWCEIFTIRYDYECGDK